MAVETTMGDGEEVKSKRQKDEWEKSWRREFPIGPTRSS